MRLSLTKANTTFMIVSSLLITITIMIRQVMGFVANRPMPIPSCLIGRAIHPLPTNHYFLTTNTAKFSTSTPVGTNEDTLVQDVLYRIRQCNNMPENVRSSLIEFQVDGRMLGKVRPTVAEQLCSIVPLGSDTPIFIEVAKPSSSMSTASTSYLTLSDQGAGTSVESRTRAVASVVEELQRQGVVTGWRDELYPVSDSFYSPPVFLMERAAVSLLGVLEYGVHINGIVRQNEGEGELMWMARRSRSKSKYPGMLDHIVAGGQPSGLTLMENVIKECEEEAGIPPHITKLNVYPTGVVSYETWEPKKDKISRVVLFNYDLHLPKDFVPKPTDGEVEEFCVWTIEQIKESISRDCPDPIKPNCYLVIVDYLLRLGHISPETTGYLDIVRELRSGDCR
jgi:8-oxo-dGTP pyrophosphatase MutT (NUDIX family)